MGLTVAAVLHLPTLGVVVDCKCIKIVSKLTLLDLSLLTVEEVIDQLDPVIALGRLLAVELNHRSARRLFAQRTEAQAGIGAYQRFVQLPLGFRIADGGQESLHANGEEGGQHDIEDRVEQHQLT